MSQRVNELTSLFLPVHRIIPFSNVDGMGNRTSIFLQGCNLNCLYCHNPETISRQTDAGKMISLATLFDKIMEARPFIRGVTFSGGEPTLHARELIPLFKRLKAEGLTCYLDSNGFFDYAKTLPLIAYTDKFLFDIKGIGDGLCLLCLNRANRQGKIPPPQKVRGFTCQNNQIKKMLQRNLSNLRYLLMHEKIEEIRLVWVKGFYDAYALVEQIAHLPKIQTAHFKLIIPHTRGTRDPQGLVPYIPTREEVKRLANYAQHCGLHKLKIIY